MKKLIPQKLKNIYHLFRSVAAAFWFGFPAKKIKVIGVTGTNGKTTTVQMIAKILEEAGHKVAVSSTINFKVGESEWVNKTKFTTLSGWHTQKFIKRAVSENCEYLVLEVASHALDQNRLWGIDFDVAAITNVTREHLDYHKTMGEYRAAKKKLFGMLKEDGKAVVNLEMENPEEYIADIKVAEIYGYQMQKESSKIKKLVASYKLQVTQSKNIELDLSRSSFMIDGVGFKLNLVGGFNVENALAAVCVGKALGVDLKTASQALQKIKKIPGRMDYVENDRGLKIIIDYALTPDSMEKLGELIVDRRSQIADLNKKNYKASIRNHKLVWVFGSCGERDRGKRPIMGEIVSRYADFAIVTNEDPFREDPQQIIDEVFSGIKKLTEGENAWRVMDRKEAIKKALNLAHEGDVVLITGKGAEETMAIGKQRIDWNDKKIVQQLLKGTSK